MKGPIVERRIFVVGVPRSGTTLVQSLLAGHSQLTSFTESHFFSRHYRILPWLRWPLLMKDPSPRVQAFLRENHLSAATVAPWADPFTGDTPRPPWQLLRQGFAVGQQLLSLLDAMASARGQACWVEKTPKHLHYLPFLEELSVDGPRTHFVHVIRGGLETVASLHKASQEWPTPYGLATCVQRWNRDLARSLHRAQHPRAGVTTDHFLFYEDLTAHPETVLRRLLNELGLPWEHDILVRYAASSKGLITERETWKRMIDRPMKPSVTSDQTLDDAQRQWVDGRLRHGLLQQLRQRLEGDGR